MKPRHLLIGLLVLAHLSVDCNVFVERGGDGLRGLFILPPPISQIGLLALWVGFGQGHFWLRLPVLAGWIVLWSWLLRDFGGMVGPHLILLLSIGAALIAGIALVFRLCGVNLCQVDIGDEERIEIVEDFRFRFSLQDLFVLSTCICICLGVCSWLAKDWQSHQIGDGYIYSAIVFSELWIALTLLAIWLALGMRFGYLRGIVCVLVVFVIAGLSVLKLSGKPQFGMGWVLALGLLLTYSSLVVLRLCGYRLANCRRFVPVTTSGQPAIDRQ